MNNYIGVDIDYNDNAYLMHYGRLGMKWGQHRFQKLYKNKDGSLNNRGKKRAESLKNKYKELTGKNLPNKKNNSSGQKKFSDDLDNVSNRRLSDKQLADKIQRLRDEQTARSLENDVRKSGVKKLISKIARDALTPAILNAGRDVMQSYLKKTLYEVSGLNKKDVDDLSELKKEWQKSDYKYKKLKTDEMLKKMQSRMRDS